MKDQISWNLEFSRAFKNARELYQFLGPAFDFSGLEKITQTYPLFLPRRLAKKIKEQGPAGVLAREFLPAIEELSTQGLMDPIGDKNFNRAPQLIHRYPSRALFTPTSICPVHCRYCFRKNELNAKDELFLGEFDTTLQYLKAHPEISEIIFTGGDPFTLSNEKLEKYLVSFADLKTIKDIRFHTRYPVVMPERFDEELLDIFLKFSHRFRTISIAIHANHVDEFDQEAKTTITKMNKLPIQLLSQTVLLKDVNDTTEDLLNLMTLFMDLKIRPYYLHHPDQVKGGMHFYLPLQTGRRIYSTLRNNLPGWALPHYVIDIPDGEGKITAFNPESFEFSGQLLSKMGHTVSFSEPDFFTH